MTSRTDELFRLECEAKHWLREGYTSLAKVEELIQRITAKRGEATADQLRQEMRRQWVRRALWLDAKP